MPPAVDSIIRGYLIPSSKSNLVDNPIDQMGSSSGLPTLILFSTAIGRLPKPDRLSIHAILQPHCWGPGRDPNSAAAFLCAVATELAIMPNRQIAIFPQ